MIIGILQPGYLPWLGFFEQMHKSDVFVIYDDVQYDRESWRNRNRIKTSQGAQWLTVPVLVNFSEHQLINQIKIDNKPKWRKKHLASIRQNYARAPFYNKYIDIFEKAFSREWEKLVDIDMYFIDLIKDQLGLEKKIIMSSSLGIEGDKIGRLIKICKHLGADVFYEGAAGRNYIDESVFLKEGIRIEFQDYKHPIYRQLYGEFVPYLSVIDLLFNHGDVSMSVILKNS